MFTFHNLQAQQAALVTRNGKISRVLTQGSHWVSLLDKVETYDMTLPFHSKTELNILLQNKQLASLLEVVQVKDGEVVFLFVNGNFSQVLNPGRYAFWKGIMNYEFVRADISDVHIKEDVPQFLLDLPGARTLVRKFSCRRKRQACCISTENSRNSSSQACTNSGTTTLRSRLNASICG